MAKCQITRDQRVYPHHCCHHICWWVIYCWWLFILKSSWSMYFQNILSLNHLEACIFKPLLWGRLYGKPCVVFPHQICWSFLQSFPLETNPLMCSNHGIDGPKNTYTLVMTNSSPWFFDGPNRNRWFTVLKNGGSFHGYVSHNQRL